MSDPFTAPDARPAGDETLEATSAPSASPDRSFPADVTQDVSPAPSATLPSVGAITSFAGQNTFDGGDKTFVRGVTATSSTIHQGGSRKQFGEYELVRELARGGMGVVYEAIQKRLKRTVAVKMILSGEFASEEQIQRFFAEARSVANLDHPNIVPVYEVAEQNGQHFFSMKLVDGGSLSSRLHTFDGKFQKTAELLEKVARAVHHAHQRGVLHRDLKPGNILLDKGGEPMVTDFGLAKIVADDSNVTRSDAVVGTPAYMAPEQVQGARYTTTSTDIWALGVILFQMLTQTQPFKGETSHETLKLVTDSEPARPRQIDVRIPRDLETICLKCLHKEQSKRYPTADALAADLRRFIAGEPVEARPVSTPERLWRWCRRNPGLATTGATAVVAAAAAIVILSVAVAIVSDREQKASKLATENAGLLASERALSRARERDNVNLRLEQAVKQCELDAGVGLLMLARVLQDAEAIDAPDLALSTRLQLSAWGSAVHPLRCVVRHEPAGAGGVRLVALTADGSMAFTHGADNRVRAFDVATAKLIGAPLDCKKPASVIQADPTSGLLLIGFQDGTTQWWHPDSSRVLPPAAPQHAEGMTIKAIAFAPKSKRVLICDADGVARLWDIATGTPARPDIKHGKPITVCAVSEYANCIATGGEDGSLRLWPFLPGPPRGETMQVGTILGLSFRDLYHQVVVVTDKVAMLHNARDGRPATTLHQPPGGTYSLAISPDGQRAITAELGDSARLMTFSGPHDTRVQLRHAASVTAQAFSADGRTVITGSGDGLARVWTVADDRVERSPRTVSDVSAVLSPDGRHIAVVTGDGSVHVSDARTGILVARLAEKGDTVSAAFSPDGRTVLTGSDDETASLWDVATQKRIGEPMVHRDRISFVAFSPDGSVFLTAGFNGVVQLRRTVDRSVIGEPIEHEQLRAAVFSPDGTHIATAGDDGTARLWTVVADRGTPREFHHDARIWSVAFSPDGTRLATAGQDAVAKLWDIQTVRQIGQPMAHQDEVQMIAFSPKGDWLATAEPSRAVRIWDARTGVAKQLISLAEKPICIAFSDDGARFAVGVGAFEGSVVLWDVAGHRAIGPALRRQTGITSVAFVPGGDAAMIATTGGDIRLHPVRPIPGKPADVAGWARNLTGAELDESGAVRVREFQGR